MNLRQVRLAQVTWDTWGHHRSLAVQEVSLQASRGEESPQETTSMVGTLRRDTARSHHARSSSVLPVLPGPGLHGPIKCLFM